MSRRDIYYWKCDRPAAFHGTALRGSGDVDLAAPVAEALRAHFGTAQVALRPGSGQGNHVTFEADVDGRAMFVRVENGPEQDGHLAIESQVVGLVSKTGVPVPTVYGCDASRRHVPFAWQALERIEARDLNHWFKAGELDETRVAFDLGAAVARWQSLTFRGFGTFHTMAPTTDGVTLVGHHANYRDYFHTQLARHLTFLVERGFLSDSERAAIERQVVRHDHLLQHAEGCFVHKDLALWNVLGTRDRIAAIIDFDDSISGDAIDDLSLLACFHGADFLNAAIDGYQSVRPLPVEHEARFWLHLMRNMIVKSVIRVGAGYFDRDDGFFLISAGGTGGSLKETTRARLALAVAALDEGWPISRLG
jgi:aminoglycoside phosphotransferase (APT) family kinase protein